MTDEREAVERVMDAVFQYHDAGVRCGVGLTDSSDQDPIYWGHESDRRYAAIKELVSAELQAAYRAGQASMPCSASLRCDASTTFFIRKDGDTRPVSEDYCPSCKARAAEGRRKA